MEYEDYANAHRATRRDVLASWAALGLFMAAMVACSHLSMII
ncbi:MAG: hypothetical protein QNJ67_16170 [Kiloniellales bacterium]|nr:hypothetical protein [Kiloniellales bacterium]